MQLVARTYSDYCCKASLYFVFDSDQVIPILVHSGWLKFQVYKRLDGLGCHYDKVDICNRPVTAPFIYPPPPLLPLQWLLKLGSSLPWHTQFQLSPTFHWGVPMHISCFDCTYITYQRKVSVGGWDSET